VTSEVTPEVTSEGRNPSVGSMGCDTQNPSHIPGPQGQARGQRPTWPVLYFPSPPSSPLLPPPPSPSSSSSLPLFCPCASPLPPLAIPQAPRPPHLRAPSLRPPRAPRDSPPLPLPPLLSPCPPPLPVAAAPPLLPLPVPRLAGGVPAARPPGREQGPGEEPVEAFSSLSPMAFESPEANPPSGPGLSAERPLVSPGAADWVWLPLS